MFDRFFAWLKSKFKKEVVTPPVVVVPSEPRPVSSDPFKKGNIGVDISHHNEDVDLVTLAKNVDFIYMKATEGTSFVSSAYAKRANELKDIDIDWGAYHYYKFKSDPISQAKHFLKYIDVNSGLPPVLDIEIIQNTTAGPEHIDDVLAFLEYIEANTGIRPILYGGYYFLRDKMQTARRPQLAQYKLWLPWYREDFAGVKCPAPWKEILIWQSTEDGQVDGVVGAVDLNKIVS